MTHSVKEIFYTLQGEGAHAGTPAVFCRFAGCNLWSGLERDRATATCRFCDTDFVGTDGTEGGKYASAEELADAVLKLWPAVSAPLPLLREGLGEGPERAELTMPSPNPSRKGGRGTISRFPQQDLSDANHRFVVCTGGEPLLQMDKLLIDALHQRGFKIAVETNGTIDAPEGIDWLCVSPKAGAELRQIKGDELKLVYPQDGLAPEDFAGMDFGRFSLQPMDGAEREANTRKTVAYCLENPLWHLSLQTHKMVGIR